MMYHWVEDYLIGMLESSLQPDNQVPLELCEKICYQKGHADPEEKAWTSEFKQMSIEPRAIMCIIRQIMYEQNFLFFF